MRPQRKNRIVGSVDVDYFRLVAFKVTSKPSTTRPSSCRAGRPRPSSGCFFKAVSSVRSRGPGPGRRFVVILFEVLVWCCDRLERLVEESLHSDTMHPHTTPYMHK